MQVYVELDILTGMDDNMQLWVGIRAEGASARRFWMCTKNGATLMTRPIYKLVRW